MVALLNETRDDTCAAKMVAHLRDQLKKNEHTLTTTKMENYDAYIAILTTVQVLRSNLDALEKIHGSHFKV